MNKLTTFFASIIFIFFAGSLFAYDPVIWPSQEKQSTSILIASESDDSYSNDSYDEFLDDEPDFLKEEVEKQKKTETIADPLYYWNYSMFHFNDKLYFWVLKPVAQGYSFVAPNIVRTGVDNFFYNIKMPIRFVNCTLQGEIVTAGHELLRFLINTTQGVLGFSDAASNYSWLKEGRQDLGLTFASYGIGDGIYIVWPFFGPSNIRDSVGMFGDRFLNPVTYIEPIELSIGISGYEAVNKTSLKIGDYEAFKNASLEPYEGMKNAYIQNRRKKIKESPVSTFFQGLFE